MTFFLTPKPAEDSTVTFPRIIGTSLTSYATNGLERHKRHWICGSQCFVHSLCHPLFYFHLSLLFVPTTLISHKSKSTSLKTIQFQSKNKSPLAQRSWINLWFTLMPRFRSPSHSLLSFFAAPQLKAAASPPGVQARPTPPALLFPPFCVVIATSYHGNHRHQKLWVHLWRLASFVSLSQLRPIRGNSSSSGLDWPWRMRWRSCHFMAHH